MSGDGGATGATGATGAPEPDRLPLRLVRGDATPEEVAALLAVLSAASGGDAEPAPRPTSRWAARADLVRRPLRPGPGAWRASARPR